jgi:excisionase family DNA binding protein
MAGKENIVQGEALQEHIAGDEEAADLGEMLDYRQVARLIGVPIGTVYAWVHARTIPHHRLGPRLVRFGRAQILAWLAGHSVPVRGRSTRSLTDAADVRRLDARRTRLTRRGR